MIKIKWFGHSMWKVSSPKCTIIIDPFTDIGFPMVGNLIADVVIASHDHYDHNNFKLIEGNPQKITQVGTYHIKDAIIKMIHSSHGQLDGKSLGDNCMSLIMIDGLSLLHCGDLGEFPDENTLSQIEDTDVLFVPVGGKYTLDAPKAKKFIELIKPKIIFPMHYRMEGTKVDIESINTFEKLFPNIEVLDTDTFEISKTSLPMIQRILKIYYE